MNFLITGTGRCGTNYLADYLSACGLDVGHERVGRDGVAAWELVARKRLYIREDVPRFDRVVHPVRSPLCVIGSWQTARERSWRFVCENSPCALDEPLVLRCMNIGITGT